MQNVFKILTSIFKGTLIYNKLYVAFILDALYIQIGYESTVITQPFK